MTSEKTRFIPISPDDQGYADLYKCECCGCFINVTGRMQELYYNFCPCCGAEKEEGEENEHYDQTWISLLDKKFPNVPRADDGAPEGVPDQVFRWGSKK